MNLVVMAYVSDMKRAVAFYESLGLSRRNHGEIDPMWNEFAIGGATFALHRANPDAIKPASDHLSLNLQVAPDEFDRIFSICQEHGYPISASIQDIGFGRFFWVTDPDGLPVQFNERVT